MQRYHPWIYAIFTVVAIMPLSTQAAVNKCVGADGKIVFSDSPCASGQTASQVKGSAKSTASQPSAARPSGPLTEADLPGEGKAQPNSNLQQYDSFCADDRRLLADAQSKIKDTLDNQNFQARKERIDKRCNPQARLAAAEKDKEGQAISCKVRHEELQHMKAAPKRPAGYADRAPEIAQGEAWLRANCSP